MNCFYLGSPDIFANIHDANGVKLPAELDPHVLKQIIDYFHGHPLNVSLDPPDMSILPEIYVAAVYFKLDNLVSKIQSTISMNYKSLRGIAQRLAPPMHVNE